MKDSPRLQIGDDPLDNGANSVDLLVEFFLPIEQSAVRGFSDGGEHVVSDVSFVAYPIGGVKRDENAGFVEAARVVPVALKRIRDPRELTGHGAGDLDVHASLFVLAGIQFPVRRPRPAWKQGAVDDVLGRLIEILSGRHVVRQHRAQDRGQPGDYPADSRLRDAECLCQLVLNTLRRRYVNATTTDVNNPRIGGQKRVPSSFAAWWTSPHRSVI